MPVHHEVVAEVEAQPDGPQIGAFFDFDGTIIAGFSAFVFIREQVKRGEIAPDEFLKLAAAMTSFGLGNMGFSAMMIATMQFRRGLSEAQYLECGEQLFREQIARRIYPESRALVQAHQSKGHTVAIVSSATRYQVEPTARDLDIEHVLCTELEVEDGKFTGGVIRPTCFGPGKVAAAEAIADRFGVDLDRSFVYSDSYDDIELLERVGNPRPLNPNSKLTRVAEERGWPISRFASRGRPSPWDWARSVAATASLVTSFAAGLPIWMLTGSRRKAQNFSYSLFAETASALIGLDLEVVGEHRLWEKRPAVFVFNHQSKADVVILLSLLRRDIAGVGKKEIRNMPVIGQVMEFGGTVLIDRKNSASAIDAMQPLVDVMRNDGRSVVIAPEGTRSVSPKLAPFKKGAFHLAMQAGVPIVPIVIHNALDVAPKGDFVFRPATVAVEVLPPVDTSQWSAGTVDQHVAEVRGLFLKALGQAVPTSVPPSTRPDTESAASATATRRKRKKRKKAAGKTSGKHKTAKRSKTAKGSAAGKPATASADGLRE